MTPTNASRALSRPSATLLLALSATLLCLLVGSAHTQPWGASCERRCNNQCVAISSDRRHCGACNSACTFSKPVCCGGGCVNLFTSTEHCGSCGSVCPEGFFCCRGRCFDAFSDANNCGECGLVCPKGSRCDGGYCSPPEQSPVLEIAKGPEVEGDGEGGDAKDPEGGLEAEEQDDAPPAGDKVGVVGDEGEEVVVPDPAEGEQGSDLAGGEEEGHGEAGGPEVEEQEEVHEDPGAVEHEEEEEAEPDEEEAPFEETEEEGEKGASEVEAETEEEAEASGDGEDAEYVGRDPEEVEDAGEEKVVEGDVPENDHAGAEPGLGEQEPPKEKKDEKTPSCDCSGVQKHPSTALACCDECRDLMNDEDACGDCLTQCSMDQRCTFGRCVSRFNARMQRHGLEKTEYVFEGIDGAKRAFLEAMSPYEGVTGVGGSGKTEHAIAKHDECLRHGVRPLFVVSVHKVSSEPDYLRTGFSSVRTHDGRSSRLAIVVGELRELFGVKGIVESYDVFFVDEAWMIHDIDAVNDLVRLGKKVVVTSITKDYRGWTFLELAIALSHAPSRSELSRDCAGCGCAHANYDHRKSSRTDPRDEGLGDSDALLVVDVDRYEPLCRKCFDEKNPGQESFGFVRVWDMLRLPVDWKPVNEDLFNLFLVAQGLEWTTLSRPGEDGRRFDAEAFEGACEAMLRDAQGFEEDEETDETGEEVTTFVRAWMDSLHDTNTPVVKKDYSQVISTRA